MQSVEERLNSRTYVKDGHLLWGGALVTGGYGKIRVGGRLEQRVHRLTWEIVYGPIPDGVHVLHLCDTPPCILPWHLYLGTQGDNMRDALRAGNNRSIRKTHCKHRHEFTKDNTYLRSDGSRACRACSRDRQRKAVR